ncbi:MAG: (d)CMP kinase [Phycisphaerae bacterium]
MIITIDGPAGSGKSTVARKLAARLSIPYLDTGAMYRVVTLAALTERVDLNDESALAALAARDDYDLNLGPTHIRVTWRGRDVTEELRTMRINDNTRYIAASPAVRVELVRRQREFGKRFGALVTEGRDQGSVAFPDADMKFFLHADIRQRAARRYHELVADGEEVDEAAVLRNLEQRDQTDSERAVAPLRKPEDAIEIDTSAISVNEVIAQMLDHLRKKGLIDANTQMT